jgi:glutaredoxin
MEARRCAAHGLIVGDDGRCVVCRRGEVEERPATSSDLPVVVFVIVIGAVLTAALGYGLTKRIARVVADRPEPAAAPPPPSADVEPPPAGPRTRPTGARNDFPSISKTAEPTAPAVELTDAELDALKRRVPITLYARPDCSLCDAARIFMRRRGYKVRELDIDASATDKVLLQSINPLGSVPTFDVDGKVLVGYDRNVLEETIEAAARRRQPR